MPISKQMVCWMTDYACYHENRDFVKSIYPLFEELVQADEDEGPDYEQATTRTLMHILKDVFARNSLLAAVPAFRMLVDHAGCPQSVEETIGLYGLLKGRALLQVAESHKAKADIKKFFTSLPEHLHDDDDAFADLTEMNAELTDVFHDYCNLMLSCAGKERKKTHMRLIESLSQRFSAKELAARMSDHIFAINEVLPLPYLEIVASGFVLPAISSHRKQLNASDFVGAVSQTELHEIHKCEAPEVAEFLSSNGITSLADVLARREKETLRPGESQEAQGEFVSHYDDEVEEFSSPLRGQDAEPVSYAASPASRPRPDPSDFELATPPGQIRVVIGSKRPGAANASSQPKKTYAAASPAGTPSKKKRWTDEETILLVDAVRELGEGKWKAVKALAALDGRTAVNIKDKWRNLIKKYGREELLRNGLCM